jgi:hypothetical protein
MSNVFENAFAAAAEIKPTAADTVVCNFTMTYVHRVTNLASYATGLLYYSPGVSNSPATFSGEDLPQLSSTSLDSDGSPFNQSDFHNLTVGVAAPGPNMGWQITLVFNPGSPGEIRTTLDLAIESKSGLAYAPIVALENTPLATFSLASVVSTAGSGRWWGAFQEW